MGITFVPVDICNIVKRYLMYELFISIGNTYNWDICTCIVHVYTCLSVLAKFHYKVVLGCCNYSL